MLAMRTLLTAVLLFGLAAWLLLEAEKSGLVSLDNAHGTSPQPKQVALAEVDHAFSRLDKALDASLSATLAGVALAAAAFLLPLESVIRGWTPAERIPVGLKNLEQATSALILSFSFFIAGLAHALTLDGLIASSEISPLLLVDLGPAAVTIGPGVVNLVKGGTAIRGIIEGMNDRRSRS